MRTYGLEIEMADVKLRDVVQLVYPNTTTWEDRYGASAKPKLNYSVWNCMSDGHIWNADGSRCMYNYLNEETGKIVHTGSSKNSIGHQVWRGAELISPAFESWEKIKPELDELLTKLKGMGATGSKGSAYIHVHVYAGDIPFESLRDWTAEFAKVQHILNVLRWPKSAPHSKSIPLYTDSLVQQLLETQSPAEYTDVYHRQNGRLKRSGAFAVRRIIDPTPAIDSTKAYDTIEFRLSRTILDTDYIGYLVMLAQETISSLQQTGKINVEEFKAIVDQLYNLYCKELDNG